MGLFHGLFSGTDSTAGWAVNYYWISFGSLLFLFLYRIVGVMIDKLFPQNRKPTPVPHRVQLRDNCPVSRTLFILKKQAVDHTNWSPVLLIYYDILLLFHFTIDHIPILGGGVDGPP